MRLLPFRGVVDRLDYKVQILQVDTHQLVAEIYARDVSDAEVKGLEFVYRHNDQAIQSGAPLAFVAGITRLEA